MKEGEVVFFLFSLYLAVPFGSLFFFNIFCAHLSKKKNICLLAYQKKKKKQKENVGNSALWDVNVEVKFENTT